MSHVLQLHLSPGTSAIKEQNYTLLHYSPQIFITTVSAWPQHSLLWWRANTDLNQYRVNILKLFHLLTAIQLPFLQLKMPWFKTGFTLLTNSAGKKHLTDIDFTLPEKRNGVARPWKSTIDFRRRKCAGLKLVCRTINWDYNLENKGLPVRMSKPSGWVRPSMISCSVCTVVFSILAVPSSPSFWITAFTFCCISNFPMSFVFPPMKDKNLGSSNKDTERDS